jgi:hypothetical protein
MCGDFCIGSLLVINTPFLKGSQESSVNPACHSSLKGINGVSIYCVAYTDPKCPSSEAADNRAGYSAHEGTG